MRRSILVVFTFFLFCSHLYGQEEVFSCPVTETYMKAHSQHQKEKTGLSKASAVTAVTGPQDLVILFVDYPEGRIQPGNILPSTDNDTIYFRNKINSGNATDTIFDAIGSMGWVVDSTKPGFPLRKKIRKYTYDDYWDMFFSVGTYYGPVHPDSASHDIKAYGSFRDYYKEVSYNNIDINPYTTRGTGSNKYQTGIVNAVDSVNGKKYVRWIMMPKSKSSYTFDGDIKSPLYPADIDPVIRAAYSRGETTLDIDTYQGKIIIVGAGSCSGGITDCNRYISVREKRYYNYNNNSTLDGIWVSVHEYGHTLGLSHLASGSYDPMNVTFSNSWNRHLYCPPHFNPLYKLYAGWISTSDFTKLRSNGTFNLSPSNSNRTFATATVYGDAMRDNDAKHSEYFALEYRTRSGFNRFSGGQNPTSFAGGALVWHYSSYGTFTFSGGTTNIGLKLYDYCNTNNIVDNMFLSNSGDPSHFYYSGHNLIDSTTNPNTGSIVHLTTGISLSNFSVVNNMLGINVNYKLGEVPTYNQFVNTIPDSSMTWGPGNVFVGVQRGPLSYVTVVDNTTVDFTEGLSYYTLRADAQSQNSIALRGAGFGSSRIQYNIGLKPSNSQPKSSITKCLIIGGTVGIGADDNSLMPTVTNNQFQNCTTDMRFVNYGPSSYKELSGYDNNSFSSNSNLIVKGKWNLANTFTIPSGVVLNIEPYVNPDIQTLPSAFKLGSGVNLYSRPWRSPTKYCSL